MKVRDSHARLNGDKTETEMPSDGLQIIADDGQTLFDVRLNGHVLEISSGQSCKHMGIIFDSDFYIQPRASNLIKITKVEYKD